MASGDPDRRRGREEKEAAGGRRTKRPRLDEEGTSSERELALHASDEDIFSLGALVTSKDILPLDVSPAPGSYPSSEEGDSFQLMKTEEEKGRKRTRTRKYRGATEEVLEGEREGERERRERRSKESRHYREDEGRGANRPSSARSSPYRSGDGRRGGRERGRRVDEGHLYVPPLDDRYYSRGHQREGDRQRGGHEGYFHPFRKGGSAEEERRGGRRGRERDEGLRRYSTSPRPSDYKQQSEWASRTGSRDGNERRERSSERSLERTRERNEKRHRKRKRSREERTEVKRERQRRGREGSVESDGSDEKGGGSPRDKIEDWIKELEGDESGEGRHLREEDTLSRDDDPRSTDEDEKWRKPFEGDRKRHSSVSDSDRSEEGEIVNEKVSSDESGSGRGQSSDPQGELSSSAAEPILRSKFDESSGSSSEGEHRHSNSRHITGKDGSVGLAPRNQNAYSGYAEVVTGSDQSDSEPAAAAADDDNKLEAGKEEETRAEDGDDAETETNVVEDENEGEEKDDVMSKLPPYLPALMGCRNVEEYEWLNRIEEGTYGVVYRARDKRSGEVVALKKLKMEKEKEGFPITSLREINMLLKAKHPNIVFVRELVVGSNMDRIYIVMDYVEHDLKALMETMKQPFLEGEVKTLLLQLLRAVHHLHDNWILHRDLKTSNLLLSHKGILKVGDFGLAREYGSPLRPYTPVVVTLWYRAPELLLGCKSYSTAIDMWSVGCIFAEFLQHKPLFTGRSEIDQLNQIFKELGTPSEEIWPGYNELPVVKKVTFTKRPYNNLRKRFPYLTQSGFDMLNKFLTFDPKRRITGEKALEDSYFQESPLPVDPSMFPTWPAKSEKVRRKSREKSPTPPIGGNYLLSQAEEDGFKITSAQHGKAAVGAGFSLKF